MKLGPSLHRVGNDLVAAYLVDTESGILLIDAGIPGQWRDLITELTRMDRSLEDIRGVVLTHGDTDHIGYAERLRREHGIPVFVSPADAARARGEVKPQTSWGHFRLAATARFLWFALLRGGMRVRYLTEVRPATDGQVLELPGAPQIIGLPGHSPGSIAVYVPIADAVFVGDGLTTRDVLTGECGPQPAPFTDDPELAIDSLSRVEHLSARWVLPGHGNPWNGGVKEAVRLVREAASARG